MTLPFLSFRTLPDESHEGAPASRPAALLALGAVLGLAYGYLEAIEITALGAIPGVLDYRTGNSAHVLWFAPLFYLGVGVVAAIPFALLARTRLRDHAPAVMVFGYLAGAVYIGLAPVEGRLAEWARVLLSVGIAVRLTVWFRRSVFRLAGLPRRALPLLAAGIPVVWTAVHLHQRITERVALSRLTGAGGAPPNVLFLVLDTQRADHLSAYGYRRATTPNIDQLAAEGVLFERAMAPSSWTLPSHASFFTGRMPQEHRAGVIRRPYLDRTYPTLAERFQAGGYATGGFVANGFWCGRQTGLDRGFIRYEDFYGNPGDAAARTALGRLLAYRVLPRFGFVDIPGRKWSDRVNRDFLHWLDELEGRPFFAFLNYLDVHGPLLPPAPYAGRFAREPVAPEQTEIDIGALGGDMSDLPPATLELMRDRYDESLLFLDAQIGALVDELRRRGLLDRTIVVVTSDHGESFGEHGMVYHGHSMYRDQLHVPLIVRHPGLTAAGLRIAEPVGAQRIAGTLLAMASLPSTGFQSAPLPLLGDDPAPFRPVLGGVGRRSMLPANWPTSRGWLTSVFLESHHLIIAEDGSIEVFQLDDRGEVRDLADDPAFAGRVRAWQTRYGVAWTSPEAAGQLRTVAR